MSNYNDPLSATSSDIEIVDKGSFSLGSGVSTSGYRLGPIISFKNYTLRYRFYEVPMISDALDSSLFYGLKLSYHSALSNKLS
ncbi:hypothetical protein MMH89_02475 [Candidatus Comchoanobacter bicostacola]|uniref:Uncharacterized protein n=1 Tax=Candidatus Comchoanobacter bicostacola TaxID=2919598 RepID=A0ABY5DJ64_9GAMM|nr:hypothetical protein [Candidatus Comchoanobacter bicostacola]UTC24092.1 hypothetical protein MMH89_02475 [Candidatus Comchoanobacter bicostacola]